MPSDEGLSISLELGEKLPKRRAILCGDGAIAVACY